MVVAIENAGELTYDSANARHLGQCEFVGETDAAMLRVLLKVNDQGRSRLGRNAAPAEQRLAGCALRGERRVTTNRCPAAVSGVHVPDGAVSIGPSYRTAAARPIEAVDAEPNTYPS